MRAFLVCLLVVFAASCAVQAHGDDASVDGQAEPPQNFDVPVGDSGPPPTCPGQLFGVASVSAMNASCTNAPETCVSSNGASTVTCSCYASEAGMGHGYWICMQM